MTAALNEVPTEQDLMDRRIHAAVDKLRDQRWLTFRGEQALELLRRTLYIKEKPILIVHCERGPKRGEWSYEYFIPISLSWDHANNEIRISGTIGPNGDRYLLNWSPTKTYDDSGTYVSYVSTLPQYFPRQDLADVRLGRISLAKGFCNGDVPDQPTIDQMRHGSKRWQQALADRLNRALRVLSGGLWPW